MSVNEAYCTRDQMHKPCVNVNRGKSNFDFKIVTICSSELFFPFTIDCEKKM